MKQRQLKKSFIAFLSPLHCLYCALKWICIPVQVTKLRKNLRHILLVQFLFQIRYHNEYNRMDINNDRITFSQTERLYVKENQNDLQHYSPHLTSTICFLSVVSALLPWTSFLFKFNEKSNKIYGVLFPGDIFLFASSFYFLSIFYLVFLLFTKKG